MVTSKERTTAGARAGTLGLLFSAAVMLFVLLFGGTASAEIDDQSSDTSNSGAGVANTGGNGAGGNGSGNTASGDQTATASGAGDESVSANQGGASNASNGSGSVHTGDANAVGNSASNNTQQTVVSGHNGAVVLVDQDATITNTGVGVANTGGNTAIGNASLNVSTADQTATATGGVGDEGVATNTGVARNSSGGDARVTTGDATATGNHATNNVNQTFDGSYSGLGVVVIVDQSVDIDNTGVGIANTGINTATGNGSKNTATATQDADATGSVAANNGVASTTSDGSADIMTGDATATGNAATNNVSQIANVTAHGSLGSIVLIDQDADVDNTGIALANTGLNTATGNLSESTSNSVQGAVSGAGPPADDSVAANDGIASTNSDGTAGIHTGHADAVGNRSNTNLTQVVNVDTAGNGIVLTDQTADVTNTGIGIANTGGNTAVGNSAISVAAVDQDADSDTLLGDDAVAANFGSASANSNGSASIHTGNANGIGNVATTHIHQTANADTSGGLFLPDQDATVTNNGIGVANTGLNTAVGNASPVNTATTTQTADVGDAAESAVASNFGEAITHSDGDATIGTGHANAIGNDSGATTVIAQTASANGSDLVLSDQTVDVTDTGVGIANTGLNLAIGNGSLNNEAAVSQTATAADAGDDAVASNFGSSLSNSNGSADITTGNANAIGSQSHTTIAQTVDANDGGLLLSDQEVTASNNGIGIANTGVNTAIGNASDVNDASVNQTADVDTAGTDDTVAANFATSSTTSDGWASIDTGAANAVGSRTTTNVAQTVDFSGDHFALVDQEVDASSSGVGIANTGVNTAIGNASDNNASLVDQEAAVVTDAIFNNVDADDIVASNDGQAFTSSDGTADISTGNASAIGNDSSHSLNVAQTADINGGGFALIDQEVTSTNEGVGIANTGLNVAIGNGSLNNESAVLQDAGVVHVGVFADLDADDIVASNNAVSNSNSNGSATIHTGAANAVGNTATTTVAQTADFNSEDGGFALVDQAATQSNSGVGIANTGLNTAVGNASESNTSLVDQTAGVAVIGVFASTDADDIVAANTATSNVTSDGDATIHTGAADAIGNESRTTIAQTADVNTDGGFALIDQETTETNTGVGIANTGGNTAVGNASDNNANGANQEAGVVVVGVFADLVADDVAAVNTATVNVSSDGDAEIRTGAATAYGNTSTTTVAQTADANFDGNGFVLYDQEAVVNNSGVGLANTGLNSATGNASTNDSTPVDQSAFVGAVGIFAGVTADDVVATNVAAASTNSNGSARITTGEACAYGNESATTIAQTADASFGGTGFVLLDQEATVENLGVAVANSGLNTAIGNDSTNTIGPATQNAAVGAFGVFADLDAEDVVAANTVTSSNVSDGTADITTGRADATGNTAATTIGQVSDTNIDGSGFVLADQSAVVDNAGVGIANTGLNTAIGNASTNTICEVQVPCTQDAFIGSAGLFGDVEVDDAAAVNTASFNNHSNGSASITTGDACACGNTSTTVINQVVDANIDGSGFVLADQVADVSNAGVGVANTGLNTAIGNASTNSITFDQDADVATPDGLIAEDVVATNTAASSNLSDGSADINTGNASAYGNVATTGINQVVDANIVGTGFVLSDQEADVTNQGAGIANTGVNVGIGNDSTNTIASTQDADIVADPVLFDDAVAANTVVGNNISTGSVDIDTGDAYALGNLSATGIAQAANYPGDGLFLADQTDSITNLGFALANSGFNTAAGNTSVNTTTNVATATAPGGVAVNTAALNNISNGSADVRTGDAFAIGNSAANSSCQGINAPINCPVPALPLVPPTCACKRPVSQPPVVPPVVHPPVTPPVPPVVPGVTPPGAVLARTGVAVGVQVLLGLLLLAIGAFLRRRARTA